MEKYEQEHLNFVKKSAAECTLFLKRDGSFPLASPCKIAAYGNGVRHTIKGGTGSGDVNSRFSINVEQGLKEAGFSITTGEWLDAYDEILDTRHKDFVKKIKSDAKAAGQNPFLFAMGKTEAEPEHELELTGDGDACIYVLSRNSGEGSDRSVAKGDVLLTDSETRDILALNAKYEKFMLVLNVGGAVDLSSVADVKNILLLSQLGVVTGNVLAEILLGRMNPSGKLATTWTKFDDYFNFPDFGNLDDNSYVEGIYVGYRYFDSVGKKAMFPFGFGMSYTHFSVEPVSVTNMVQEITVTAKVSNIGDYAGKDVVQVYVSCPSGKLDKPYQDLAAFVKTKELLPGESQTVTATFYMSDIASYDTSSAAYVLEKGLYVISVGDSSVDTIIAGAISLADDIKTMKVKNVIGDPGFNDFVPSDRAIITVPGNVTTINLSESDFKTVNVVYDKDYPVDDVIAGLSDEELAYINTGAFDPNAKGFSVIGNASFSVAGAAGETTSVLRNKGVRSIVMADGPAGLRLSKHYYEDENGAHGIDSSFAGMEDFMGGASKLLMKIQSKLKRPKKDKVIKNQYATAIPIGTAIAQTFNYDLAKNYGNIVGDEMERFHVQLWLAPALNIHRSILCGRDFEYYSEDPLVSGLMAAAITEGVQSHKGCGTTIKHYAANNAETNRYFNNSKVSERAMREIYLKGFGICVRKAQPHAIMTSYNLLNGTHTAEHRGLIEDILRCEYGYQGIVMTDWVVDMMVNMGTSYREALAAEVVKAGGDLFMPGSKKDFDGIVAGLKDGSIPRKQIQQNATRIYRMAEKLKIEK